jgi:hypothetical protein
MHVFNIVTCAFDDVLVIIYEREREKARERKNEKKANFDEIKSFDIYVQTTIYTLK